jgi:dolichol-phosphate mannosyltransferase
MKVSILVPAYNEEEGINETIDRLQKVRKNIKIKNELIIVNDGSSDKTAELVRKKKVKLIDYKKNSGKGSALKKAIKRINADIIATTDADCTYEVEKIPEMIDILIKENCDLVVGSRFIGKIKGGMSRLNWIGNIIFSNMVYLLTGIKTTDASSGLRVFKKKSIENLRINAKGLDFEIEMTTRANMKKLKVVEVPIVYEKRVGVSKLHPIVDGWRFFKAMIIAYLEK